MKYEDVKIFSHPRSGTNYFGALIQYNFLDGGSFESRLHKNSHIMSKTAERFIKNNPDTAIFYIYRNFHDVINSVFNARDFFGLIKVQSLEHLMQSRYCDLWSNEKQNKNRMVQKKYKNLDAKPKRKSRVSTYFSKITLKPYEYWERHLNSWFDLNERYSNVYLVRYEDLIDPEKFQNEMLKIAEFLGSDKTSFRNIKERVGVIPLI